MLCPGGFGSRGSEGKIIAIEYARVNKIPYLGICLGMQLAVVEFCRNVLEWTKAQSEELKYSEGTDVIVFMPEVTPDIKGGSMRLGSKPTKI